jgi:hypothetical protein
MMAQGMILIVERGFAISRPEAGVSPTSGPNRRSCPEWGPAPCGNRTTRSPDGQTTPSWHGPPVGW